MDGAIDLVTYPAFPVRSIGKIPADLMLA